MFYKTSLLDDIYGIRNELLYQCIGLSVALFLYILTVSVFAIINPSQLDSNSGRIEWLCHYIISILVSISIGLISTYYPIQFIKKQEGITILRNVSPESNSEQEWNKNSEYLRHTKAMEFIISDYNSFKQFMQYLVKS